MSQQLIFVYNAKSGFLNSAKDLMHKTAKPSTYPCKLCALTYNGPAMNKLWKQYIDELPMPTVFLHNNEFAKKHPDKKITPPVILLDDKTIISSSDFEAIDDLPSLMKAINLRLKG